jgi:hypothetical protein
MHDARSAGRGFAEALPSESLGVERDASRFQPGELGELDAVGRHVDGTHGLFAVQCRELLLGLGTPRPRQPLSQQDGVVDGRQEVPHDRVAAREQRARGRNGVASGC